MKLVKVGGVSKLHCERRTSYHSQPSFSMIYQQIVDVECWHFALACFVCNAKDATFMLVEESLIYMQNTYRVLKVW